MTEVAISYLLADLGDLGGGPTQLRGIAVDSIGVEPGPVHPIEPRHWYWALIEYPDFAIVLRGSTT